jgi:hypothetical protein
VLFEPNHGVALTFDIDLSTFGPWYGHAESEIEASLASIQRVAEMRPRIVVSSHKGIITDDIQGRLSRYAAKVEQRDQRLRQMLTTPKTLAALLQPSPIYGGYPYAPHVLSYWEANMIAKHLQRMVDRGEIVVEGARYRLR